jgi:protoheme IX farnesyltransferase
MGFGCMACGGAIALVMKRPKAQNAIGIGLMTVATQGSAKIEYASEGSVRASAGTLLADIATLLKLRLTGMVVITAMVGYIIGSSTHVDWLAFFGLGLGTWLLAGSASSLNQWWEIGPDGQMQRTCNRPLPAARIGRSTAMMLAIFTGVFGVICLLLASNVLTCLLGVANLVIYAFIYTPLKRVTTLNTVVGAICGGVPPLMGFAAASGGLTAPAYLLAAILFIWQIPHFLALAWMYKEDYARAGFRMLPIVDVQGKTTGNMAVLYSLLLIPLVVGITLVGSVGIVFLIAGALLSAGLVVFAQIFRVKRDRTAARRLFLASILYLPLLLVLMLGDRIPYHAHQTSARHPLVLKVSRY